MLSEEVGLQALFEEASPSGEVHSTTSVLNVLRESFHGCTVALTECCIEFGKGLHDGGGVVAICFWIYEFEISHQGKSAV